MLGLFYAYVRSMLGLFSDIFTDFHWFSFVLSDFQWKYNIFGETDLKIDI